MRKSVQEAKQSIHEARGGNRSGERRPGEDEVVVRDAGPLKPVGDNCVRVGHGQTHQAREAHRSTNLLQEGRPEKVGESRRTPSPY